MRNGASSQPTGERVLLAVDPGGTTGVALFHDSAITSVGVICEPDHLFALIRSLPTHATVVCEDFTATRLTSDAIPVLKLIGAIDYIVKDLTGVPPCYHRQQDRRSFLPLAKAILGLRTPSGSQWLGHHYDATAHGLCYLKQHFPTVEITSYTVSEMLEIVDPSTS